MKSLMIKAYGYQHIFLGKKNKKRQVVTANKGSTMSLRDPRLVVTIPSLRGWFKMIVLIDVDIHQS